MAIVTMRELLEAGIHFGHQTRRWHPKMRRYIFGQRNGIYIIDLQHTLRQLYKAYGMVRDTVANGGSVLFVGTKKQAQEIVKAEAERCGMFYVTNRWLGGTLTNFKTVRGSIQELERLQELESSGKIEKFGKKEQTQLRKQREKLEKNLSGIQRMTRLPEIVFIVDAKREAMAAREADRLELNCIAVVDTNCNPEDVHVPIPGNDDAIRAVSLYCRVLANAAIEGKARAEKFWAEREQERNARGGAVEIAQASEPAGIEVGVPIEPAPLEQPVEAAAAPAPAPVAAASAAGETENTTATEA